MFLNWLYKRQQMDNDTTAMMTKLKGMMSAVHFYQCVPIRNCIGLQPEPRLSYVIYMYYIYIYLRVI